MLRAVQRRYGGGGSTDDAATAHRRHRPETEPAVGVIVAPHEYAANMTPTLIAGIGPVGIVFLVLLWVLPIYVGDRMGRGRGQTALGVVLGVLLGWIGVLVLLLVNRRPAPA